MKNATKKAAAGPLKIFKVTDKGLRAESRRHKTYKGITNGMLAENFKGERGDLYKLIATGAVELRAEAKPAKKAAAPRKKAAKKEATAPVSEQA